MEMNFNTDHVEDVKKVTSIEDGTTVEESTNGEEISSIDSNVEDKQPDGDKPAGDNTEDGDKEFSLEVGQIVEFDGESYTVSENGDLLDKDGNVFKESADVKEWVESFDETEEVDSNTISIANLITSLDFTPVDESGNVIEFENSVDGVKSFIESVVESRENEVAEEVLNNLYSNYPILQNVIPYVIANGGNLEGFNQTSDRSQITIDEGNDSQQADIIKMAWKEKGMTGDVNAYIEYLKNTGALFATANSELEALKKSDEDHKLELQRRADEADRAKQQQVESYWNDVKSKIDSGKLADYNLPKTIIRNVGGKKVSSTPNDFFNYVYQVDKQGRSRYENEMAAKSKDDILNDELIRAYLSFTGGSYKDLVEMAIQEKEVKRLVIKSNNRRSNSTSKPNVKPNTSSGKVMNFG